MYKEVERVGYLKRAKVVLNMHFSDSFHLETLRLQLLLAMKCFVISEQSDDLEAQRDFQRAVIFSRYDNLVNTVLFWLKKPARDRQMVAEQGYSYSTFLAVSLLLHFISFIFPVY